MPTKTQAELKAERRAASEKELAKRKEQAEKAVGSTTGLLKGAAEKIKKRQKLLESI